MFQALLKRLDSKIGLHSETSRQRIFLLEKLEAFVPRMPWVYAILLVNLGGVLVSLSDSVPYLSSSGVVIFCVMSLRLVHWLRMPSKLLSETMALTELRRIFMLGVVVTATYCCWILSIFAQSQGDVRNHLIMFGSLAALGVSYALSPLPSAAKVPLYLLAVPLAGLLVVTGDIAHAAMGCTLLTLVFVSLKLIEAQNVTFTRLVHSRLDIELEKRRAESAERRAIIERSLARKLADTDVLTGLANRRALLAEADSRALDGRSHVAVTLFDLDGFKAINDTFGHSAGDALLIAVSRRLYRLVGDMGLVARLGGDEFAVLLFEGDEASTAELVAEAVECIAAPYPQDGRNLMVSVCAGVAFHEEEDSDPTQTIRRADLALFAAKRRGRGTIELFSDSLEMDVKRRAQIETALRAPGVAKEIELAFQPIVDLTTMELSSFEALARWRHSELGWINPSEFIPITEQISVVERISDALLSRAAAEAACWPEAVRLSFNLSAVQLCSEASAARILELVDAAGLNPSRLQLEVTETALLADFDAARRNLAELDRAGVRLVLDDFGAGYASISYLREMRFHAIKLDGSLITAATNESGGLALLKGVLDLCRAVGLPCIAEHLETEAQVITLRGLGCRYGQGYYLSRPMSAEGARHVAMAGLVDLAPAQILKKLASNAAR
jgi:diguanylate cyclase (GGDEF)-like protein